MPPGPNATQGAEDEPPRWHGLERPFDALQYVAFFAYGLFIAAFAILHAPMITPGVWGYIVIALFSVWMPVCLASYIIAALSQCHDPVMNEPPMTDEMYHKTTAPKGFYKCLTCRHVCATTSKHCFACGKCVSDFDHHCRWLNHCVGARNYLHFSLFLGNSFALLLLQAALGWYFCAETVSDFDAFHRRAERAFNVVSFSGAVALAVFIWFIAVLQAAVVAVLGQLFMLHVELSVRGVTTYELILLRRYESRLRQQERDDLGLARGPPSPTCHSFIVWNRRRELGITAPVADQEPRSATYAPNVTEEYATEARHTPQSREMPNPQPAAFNESSELEDEPSLRGTPQSSGRSGRSSRGSERGGDASPQMRSASFARSVGRRQSTAPLVTLQSLSHSNRGDDEAMDSPTALMGSKPDSDAQMQAMNASCTPLGHNHPHRRPEPLRLSGAAVTVGTALRDTRSPPNTSGPPSPQTGAHVVTLPHAASSSFHMSPQTSPAKGP
jgi:uncharacterized membrane protein YgcG